MQVSTEAGGGERAREGEREGVALVIPRITRINVSTLLRLLAGMTCGTVCLFFFLAVHHITPRTSISRTSQHTHDAPPTPRFREEKARGRQRETGEPPSLQTFCCCWCYSSDNTTHTTRDPRAARPDHHTGKTSLIKELKQRERQHR